MQQKEAVAWTTSQIMLQQWLALPKRDRKPKTLDALADEMGVDRGTLHRWKQQPGFMDAVYAIAEEHLGDDMPEIYAALRREAKAGSFQHIKLVLELTGRYVEQQKVSGEIRIKLDFGEAMEPE